MFFIDILIDEKSLGETFDQLLTIAEDDCRVLKRETELVKTLKLYNHLRKSELFGSTVTSNMEILFDSLVKFERYPQAIEVGDELIHRYEEDKSVPPGKLETILKRIVIICSNNEEKKKYKLKLYGIYMNDNNWDTLQSAIIDHMTNLVPDKENRENVKSGLNELMYVFKLQYQGLKDDILKEVNDRLVGKSLSPITITEKKNTYDDFYTEERSNIEDITGGSNIPTPENNSTNTDNVEDELVGMVEPLFENLN